MNDRPTSFELLAAARKFLEAELIPRLTDARLKFQTLVTANVLAIVERELQMGDEPLIKEWKSLATTLELQESCPDRHDELREAVVQANKALCERIRRGDFDASTRFAELLGQLKTIVEWKLEVANPRYLAASRTGP